MPRSLAENKWKEKKEKNYSEVCNFCWSNGTAATTAMAAVERVQNILTEFGLNPLKFSRKDGKKRKILLEASGKLT